MNVLIADFDLFNKEGGGQTVYRNIILRNPSIRFWYLQSPGLKPRSLPANACAIPYRQKFRTEYQALSTADETIYSDYLIARNIADCVSRMSFDVVDVPDYYSFGAFLLPAFYEAGVRVQRQVQSLHGRLSKTHFINWNQFELLESNGRMPSTDQRRIHEQKTSMLWLEDKSLQSADIRYGISNRYIDELRTRAPSLTFEYLNPMQIQTMPVAAEMNDVAGARPTVLFVGRLERAKGPDIFLDLLWLSGARDLANFRMIGSDDTYRGRSVREMLGEKARQRNLQIEFANTLDRTALLSMFEQPSLILCTSRFESFGLTIVEALLRGSIVGMGSHCGVHAFVQETWPTLRFASLEIENLQASATVLRETLESFSLVRQSNIGYLNDWKSNGGPRHLPTTDFMHAIYSANVNPCGKTRDELEYNYICQSVGRRIVCSRTSGSGIRGLAKRVLPHQSVETVRRTKAGFLSAARWIRHSPAWLRRYVKAKGRSHLPVAVAAILSRARRLPESPIDCKTIDDYRLLMDMARSQQIGRGVLFRALSLVERRRHNPRLSCLYLIRCARWTGEIRGSDLNMAVEAYQSGGFRDVAEILPFLISRENAALQEQCTSYLKRRIAGLSSLPPADYEFCSRLHQTPRPRVSIIVSLYNARDYLQKFLGSLQHLDMVRSRQAEVVLVDSGSNEVQVSSDEAAGLAGRMELTCLRTASRETIAQAWNRGIKEARGEYLVFLGADETLTHNALGRLTEYLDANPNVDWVIGDTLLLNVDREGRFKNEVMVYDRAGMTPFSSILDGTYLNYVGGMYRRSLHERAGYYDPSFTAASDTEFKYRAFPFCRSAHLSGTFGVFMNYPSERVTEHPRAELEDLRALHLFKTPGGIAYLMQNRDQNELFELLRQSLWFRRCYSTSFDTDFDLAMTIIRALVALDPGSERFQELQGDIAWIQGFMRSMETLEPHHATISFLARQAMRLARLEKQHRRKLETPVGYHCFNDVRFAIHANVWNLKENVF